MIMRSPGRRESRFHGNALWNGNRKRSSKTPCLQAFRLDVQETTMNGFVSLLLSNLNDPVPAVTSSTPPARTSLVDRR